MLLFTLYIRVHSLHSTYRIYYIFSQIQSTRNNNEPIFKIHAMPFSRWATFVKPLASPKEWSYCNLHPLPMGRYAPSDGLVVTCEAHCLFRVSRCLRWNLPVVSRTNFAVGKLLSIPTRHDTSALYIMWTRNGGFDNKPRFPFRPNHFVPLSRGISYFHSLNVFPASHSSSPVLVSSSDHQLSSHPASSGNSLWSHTSPFHLRKSSSGSISC